MARFDNWMIAAGVILIVLVLVLLVALALWQPPEPVF